jgi:glycerol-3-phosphate cytidylyltransferase
MVIGYTQGTFDVFHIGHLNLLRNARSQCDKLIVGVNTDSLVEQYKHHSPVIGEMERLEIVRSMKWVDEVMLTSTLDKRIIYDTCPFDKIFIGDDWKGNPRWLQTERDLSPLNVEVVYLPHTDGVSTTQIREEHKEELYDIKRD